MIQSYRKRPVIVEAVEVQVCNFKDVVRWCKAEVIQDPIGGVYLRWHNKLHDSVLEARVGDYIIKGEKEGDFYPCKADVFEKTYEVSHGVEDKEIRLIFEKGMIVDGKLVERLHRTLDVRIPFEQWGRISYGSYGKSHLDINYNVIGSEWK